MKEYESKSYEELRFEDYQLGRKGILYIDSLFQRKIFFDFFFFSFFEQVHKQVFLGHRRRHHRLVAQQLVLAQLEQVSYDIKFIN